MQLHISNRLCCPAPLFDGVDEAQAVLKVDCVACEHAFSQNLLASLDKGAQWFGGLTKSEQRYIATELGLRFAKNPLFQAHDVLFDNDRAAYFADLSCPQCQSHTLAVVDFYEKQPSRYVGTLMVVAELTARCAKSND